MYWLQDSSIASHLDPIDSFCCIIGAAVHDVDHPGTTSDFQIRAQSPLAILYNDTSVLENHHVAITFKILKKHRYAIFNKFSNPMKAEIRTALISMVLATDISRHVHYLGELKRYCHQQRKISKQYKKMENNQFRMSTYDPNEQTDTNIAVSENTILNDTPNRRHSARSNRKSTSSTASLNSMGRKNSLDKDVTCLTHKEIRSLFRNVTIKLSDLSNPTRYHLICFCRCVHEMGIFETKKNITWCFDQKKGQLQLQPNGPQEL